MVRKQTELGVRDEARKARERETKEKEGEMVREETGQRPTNMGSIEGGIGGEINKIMLTCSCFSCTRPLTAQKHSVKS